MKAAKKKLSRTVLRRNLDEPTRAQLYFVIYILLDRAQLCAKPVERLKEARQHLDSLIASYSSAGR